MNTALVQAYIKTKYKVPELGIEILIGKESDDLDNILKKYNVISFAFITAWNPFSRLTEKIENEGRNLELFRDLSPFTAFNGHGEGEDPRWEPEKSYFILGISKERAIELSSKYEQNAFVYGEKNQEVELIFTNPEFDITVLSKNKFKDKAIKGFELLDKELPPITSMLKGGVMSFFNDVVENKVALIESDSEVEELKLKMIEKLKESGWYKNAYRT